MLYTLIFVSNTTCFSSSASFRFYFLLFFKKRLIITLFACRCYIIKVLCIFLSYRKVSVKFVVFETHVFSLVKSSVQRPFRLLLLLLQLGSINKFSVCFVTHKNNTHAHLSMIPLRTWDWSWWLVCVCLSVIMCIDFRSLSLPNR